MTETNSNNEVPAFLETPNDKTERKRRKKLKKERVHIYLTADSIEKIEKKGAELGLDRSNCIQVLVNFALNNFKTLPR